MSKYWLLLSIFVIFVKLPRMPCDRILCIFQMPAVSHQATFQPISRALSLRGHEVVAVTPHPINDPNLKNLTEIDISRGTYEIINRHGFEFFMTKELTVHSKIKKIFSMYNEIAYVILGNDEFKKLYMDGKQKFDLIICQIYISPIMFALSKTLEAPVIGVSSMGGWSGTHVAAGNPNPPSIYSEMFLPYNGHLTFQERIKSTLYFLWAQLYVYFIAIPECDKIARKFLGEDLPYLADIEKNVSALFLNINPILYTPRPLVPTIVPISFMHIQPPKQLPQDIKNEIEHSKNGVVYFSLGSNVKSVNIPIEIRSTLIQAFAELPYKVLWKFEKEELEGKPENVIVRKWLPQQDILAHPNVKVFVSQCGLQSTEEAIDREVPMVGIPFIADQEMNSRRLAQWGVLREIDYLNTTKEEIIQAITDVAENPTYRQNMKRLRQLLQDEPMTGIEKAVWWAEYVIRHKGTVHLRSPTGNVEWHKYLLLDVLAATIGCLFLPFLAILEIIKLIFKKSGRNIKKQ